MKDYMIITGGSRGVGLALVHKFLSEGYTVIALSRKAPPVEHQAFSWVESDLSRGEELVTIWGKVNGLINSSEARSISLIHNAASLIPMGKIGNGHSSRDYNKGVVLNLAAPMVLSEMFVRDYQAWKGKKRMIFLSSGAAHKPYEGWGMYCATKAGLEMFVKVFQGEQADQAFPVRMAAVAPGVVDTDMQSSIRKESQENFPMIERFLKLKEEGKLWSPAFVAEEMFELIEKEDFGKETSLDLRTWRNA